MTALATWRADIEAHDETYVAGTPDPAIVLAVFLQRAVRSKRILYAAIESNDQATLHRELALRGYVPELLASDEHCDYWRWYHPDGPRP